VYGAVLGRGGYIGDAFDVVIGPGTSTGLAAFDRVGSTAGAGCGGAAMPCDGAANDDTCSETWRPVKTGAATRLPWRCVVAPANGTCTETDMRC